ncbi:5-(carboxyamino)imidazole ribonucleotide mutase [Candidatus Kaiserbacteria bacterium RIFCSPHIGHO2_02_FULL_59_21]|uniref:N5-carboxyaminoimidazole ribonucleotide mutase n=2 Tax=Candidatus Kaiseribacteriota TaxID=1752734 RepID=A0A0G1YUZ7_9BACT|nr:MAG: N5-carboxyaminoimidazole ribonucleotide mutase [Candidatus Kaiserbacteria bacterium GW2011_GWA2_58_9]OGG63059.1 MAG: 5-(carboxyamino)imidazole ribonucleotide mutase [Candidatus Kaiserbacteria bacterium RIFCSPHIGHO2_01_FULL_58_22]OGG67422.1 MAG: 5-(carboxyamino)imidazole ribonucleotide mutase [Candidatus Kaiserbacteria bacterium RIFCSPHIGHO2_02_FULL_59_21]OGG80271.1 MAG: 5-(carboxyamino)imidazole ribonucleotide mutase [Candidatus Kaiserbacteria bacterium RIFCSPLOWO2_01_FULL_59_34]OGG8579
MNQQENSTLNAQRSTLVGILMGSDSDLPVMQEAAKVLEEFGIGSEVHTLSAHRTPEAVVEYVKKSEANGCKVFICGAGGAAHLAGVVAAHTALPVIGVPIENKTAKGIDALFSTVQMPPGIPVATVAINGAKNAGILAAQIIGTGHPHILKYVSMYKAKMAKDIEVKDNELQEKGFKKYLEDKGLI